MANTKPNTSWQPPLIDGKYHDAYMKWCKHTHFFLQWFEEENVIGHCFNIDPVFEESVIEALKNKELYKLSIFEYDIDNRDEVRLAHIKQMEAMFAHFFKDALEIEAIIQGYFFSFDLARIALPKKKYNEIVNFISEYNLSDISDLIFYIISKAQTFFYEQVYPLEFSLQSKIINSIGKEVENAIELIELTASDFSDGIEKYYSNKKIIRINFLLDNKTIKITDPLLTKDFVKSFKDSYSNGQYKNWKLQLHLMSYMYDDEKVRLNFKFHYAIALYNFLTQTQKFNLVKGTPYPNNLMQCIYKLLEFSLIRFTNKEGEMLPALKIKTVRNWIKNHELKQEPPLDKINPDFNKLNLYFDNEFIHSSSFGVHKQDIQIGLNLCLMFKTEHLQNEIVYLITCLKEWNFRVNNQLESGFLNPNSPLPNEYETLKHLINATNTNQPLESITFKISGDERTYTLSDKLPIHLIQAAIKTHYNEFREDYEVDILQSEIKSVNGFGSFSINATGNFNLPEERFLPKFIDAFFNFLQKEAPALEKEYDVANRHYMLITKALQFSGYFHSQFPYDSELQSKVMYWHSLINK